MAHDTNGPRVTALQFSISARSASTRARRGVVRTPSGLFETPAFMPVGTRGSVKGVLPGLVRATGAQVVLANTYHLLLRPGPDLVARRGGLHRFIGWNAPILTDSGGYQAYSMADSNTITDDGVRFKSIVDGSTIELSPERATQVQNALGADIIMAFDDCPPARPLDGSEAASDPRLVRATNRDARRARVYDHAERLREANERTVRWLERCCAAHQRPHDQALFGIVQGGVDLAQREWSAERICAIDLPGYAIGGVAVGESPEDIARVVRHTAPLLPEDRPRYLMGVGYERDLLNAVLAGVDMFDCVLPTRNGRNANAFTRSGQIRLRNAQFAEDDRPIEEGCDCPACAPMGYPVESSAGSCCKAIDIMGLNNSTASNDKDAGRGTQTRGASVPVGDSPFTRAYIRHLFLAGEMLGPILVTLHNLRHFQRFMAEVRATIASDDWEGLIRRWPVAATGSRAGESG
ncbi:MAG: queuine tRNA-ribosyltransferase [Phycisphaeraceae bacterium]|nr:queuine tRNA-ribosyltransferase [Phycisphaeraceae bacterium]